MTILTHALYFTKELQTKLYYLHPLVVQCTIQAVFLKNQPLCVAQIEVLFAQNPFVQYQVIAQIPPFFLAALYLP